MPDRVIRDEVLESGRWLFVADQSRGVLGDAAKADGNVCRLAFLACCLKADPMGNMDAEPTRLYRLWRDFGPGTVEQSEDVLAQLERVDLVRSYPVDKKRFIHIPRFRQSLRFAKRLHPPSPWDAGQSQEKQGHAKKSHGEQQESTESAPSAHTVHSAGVGVGVEEKRGRGTSTQNPSSAREDERRSTPVEKDLDGKSNGHGNPEGHTTGIAEAAAALGRKMTTSGQHMSRHDQLQAVAAMLQSERGGKA